MPTVAIVDGVKIEFYFDEHPPPHFHAVFAEMRAQVNIETLTLMKGELPPAKQRRVVAWARTRREELMAAWARCEAGSSPGRIG